VLHDASAEPWLLVHLELGLRRLDVLLRRHVLVEPAALSDARRLVQLLL